MSVSNGCSVSQYYLAEATRVFIIALVPAIANNRKSGSLLFFCGLLNASLEIHMFQETAHPQFESAVD